MSIAQLVLKIFELVQMLGSGKKKFLNLVSICYAVVWTIRNLCNKMCFFHGRLFGQPIGEYTYLSF